MEEGLLLLDGTEERKERSRSDASCGGVVMEEMKKLGYLSGPMVAVTLSQYLLQVVSIMMAGHLGELSLSSTGIAFSLASVTGFSLMEMSTVIVIEYVGEWKSSEENICQWCPWSSVKWAAIPIESEFCSMEYL